MYQGHYLAVDSFLSNKFYLLVPLLFCQKSGTSVYIESKDIIVIFPQNLYFDQAKREYIQIKLLAVEFIDVPQFVLPEDNGLVSNVL